MRPLQALRDRVVHVTGWRIIRARDHHVIPRNYYSPIPDRAELTDEVWDRRSPMAGIEVDLDAQIEFARQVVAPHLAEFDPARAGKGFEIDGDVLFGILRTLKPARMVELGSGASTLAAAQALERNASDGAPCTYRVFDPFPRGGLPSSGPWELEELRAQDVPLEAFTALECGDVLFVDTTHTVRMGGDVNRVVLDVLPLLRAGVLVHFHDIWLPWEYHRGLVDHMGFFAEQYLLQAYLADNPRFRILFAAQALVRERREFLEELVPRFGDLRSYPSSFWIEVVSDPPSGRYV